MRTLAKLDDFVFNLLPRPPYSPDCSPQPLQLVADRKTRLHVKSFGFYEELVAVTEAYFEAKDKPFNKFWYPKVRKRVMIEFHLKLIMLMNKE